MFYKINNCDLFFKQNDLKSSNGIRYKLFHLVRPANAKLFLPILEKTNVPPSIRFPFCFHLKQLSNLF